MEHGVTDTMARRCDAGTRFSQELERDMVAVPIKLEMRMAVVGAPSRFAGRSPPVTPQNLTGHRRNNLRQTASGQPYA